MSSIQTPNTPWFPATIGLLGLIVGYVAAGGIGGILSAGDSAPLPPTADQPPVPEVVYEPPQIGDNPILGDANAPVTIIEFSDYQCPYCTRHYEQTFGLIKEAYVDTGKVKYVIRDFPLQPKTEKVAEAGKCAAAQNEDAYWEMHAALVEQKDAWVSSDDPSDALKRIAAELGLNADTFATCLDTGEQTDAVQADRAAGQASGISGTPGFWILGPGGQSEMVSGAYPYETFQAVFDDMLN